MRVALRRIDKWWCFAGGETVIHIHPFMLWEYPSASFLYDQPSAIHRTSTEASTWQQGVRPPAAHLSIATAATVTDGVSCLLGRSVVGFFSA